MPMKKYRSGDELIDSIIHRPWEAFFNIKMDSELLKRMNDNSVDIADSVCEIASEIVMLGWYMLIYFCHIGEFVFFPVVKVIRFVRLRAHIIKNEKRFRAILRDENMINIIVDKKQEV